MTESAVATTATDTPFFESVGLPLGIQLFPILPDLREDFEGTLQRVADIGYQVIETAGLVDRSAQEFRAALDKVGLTCGGMHVQGRPIFGNGPNLDTDIEGLIAEAKALGTQEIVMPLFFFPEGFTPPEGLDPLGTIHAAAAELKPSDYRLMAEFLNAKGAHLAKEGLRLSYHNHNVEFAPMDGTTGLEILLAETDPRVVSFELDIGWAAVAQFDTQALFAKHPGRIRMLHVKDIAEDTPKNFMLEQNPAPCGKGVIDFATMLPQAYAAGTRAFFIEQEPPFEGDRLDAMEANYDYFKGLRTAAS